MTAPERLCLADFENMDEEDYATYSDLLLVIEPLGILTRHICYEPVLLEGEVVITPVGLAEPPDGGIPTRLFFIPKHFLLVHCYGDARFYEENPEYTRGGLSKECYILDAVPRFLAYSLAMEGEYAQVGFIPEQHDPLALASRAPPPITRAEQKRLFKASRQKIKDRAAAAEVEENRAKLTLVK